MTRVIWLRISLLSILRGLQRRDIGLKENDSVGDLDGFRVDKAKVLPCIFDLTL